MKSLRAAFNIALLSGLALLVSACSQTSSTQSASANPTATPAVKATPQSASTLTPVSAPTGSAVSPSSSTPRSSAGAISYSDLDIKAQAVKELSFSYKIAAGGQVATTKAYIKSSKMRYEMNTGGHEVVLLMDSVSRDAYVYIASQKSASKVDYDEAFQQTEQPNEGFGGLAKDAKSIGIETVGGHEAAVYQMANSTTKVWFSTETGLILKFEATASQGKLTVEFADYQFGPLDDSLFQLPADVRVTDQ